MDLREIGWGGMEWIDLAQNRERCRALVKTAMKFRVPENSWEDTEYLHNWRFLKGSMTLDREYI
jgi:hypothetical protein